MTPTLESLATCFQGLLPAQLMTCSLAGVPNTAYLSHVDYVDPQHVALSFQFFNKSRRNIAENPHALVIVNDPDTGQGWRLRLTFVRSETAGPLFDRMALRIEAIASYCGLKGIFKLRAADIYRVISIEPAPGESGTPLCPHPAGSRTVPDAVFTLKALQDLSERTQCADTLEKLVDSILAGLEESFGFRQSMILVPSEEQDVLVTIATRGYPEGGVGAEVRVGQGICGMVAEARKPIRISGLMRGLLYAYAMHRDQVQGDAGPVRPRIPLPGLANPQSQLGVPLLVRGELVGVLCLESEVPYRFHEEDKASIELLGSYLAIAIQNMQFQEREADGVADEPKSQGRERLLRSPGPQQSRPGGGQHEVVYYLGEDCILVDGDYLIRGLPARILWKVLTARRDAGREEFTNRELRLDKALSLPEWKDNLESRLLLLRRRLEQKCPFIRLAPTCRGRFAVHVTGELSLSTRP